MFRLFQFPEFHYWYKCFCSCLLTIFLQNVGYDTDQYISCIKYCLIFFFLNLGLFLSIFLWSEINDRKCFFFVILLRLLGYSWSTFYSSYFPRIKLSRKRKLITFFRFENWSQTQSIIVILTFVFFFHKIFQIKNFNS